MAQEESLVTPAVEKALEILKKEKPSPGSVSAIQWLESISQAVQSDRDKEEEHFVGIRANTQRLQEQWSQIFEGGPIAQRPILEKDILRRFLLS
eukprot:symbB.v1.2.014279.t1/scaffold1042.1/size142359/3